MEIDTPSTRTTNNDKTTTLPKRASIANTPNEAPNGNQNASGKQNKNKKKKQPTCAWCGAAHNYWMCKTKGGGKWDNKKCKHCKE